MNKKPEAKSIIIINLVNNIPMAIVMSTAAPLLGGQAIEFYNWLMNVLIAFVIACALNAIIPVPLIAKKFQSLFKLDDNTFVGRLVGNVPIAMIFVIVIGLILTYYNVRMVPVFIFAFLKTFLPLYVICFAISMITNPAAMKFSGYKVENEWE